MYYSGRSKLEYQFLGVHVALPATFTEKYHNIFAPKVIH